MKNNIEMRGVYYSCEYRTLPFPSAILPSPILLLAFYYTKIFLTYTKINHKHNK